MWCNYSFFDRNGLSQYTDVVEHFNTQGGAGKTHLMENLRADAGFRIIWLLQDVSWQIQQSLSSLAANIKPESEELDVIFDPSFKQQKSGGGGSGGVGRNSYFSHFCPT